MTRWMVLSLVACASSPEPPPSPPQWRTMHEPDRAVLSVWGTRDDEVFVVGGPLGNEKPTLAMRWDGSRFVDLNPGGTETFWWVNGTSSTDVWMVGTNGRIAHYDGRAFSAHASATTATLWGVWAFAPNDVWACGGTPGKGTAEPNDIVLHFDGASWKRETLPGAPLGRSLFKVWGTSSSDLYVVGEAGTIWHRRGTAWALEPAPATGTLFTVHGCSSTEVYAVGGNDVLRSDGSQWSRVTIDLSSQVNGVSCAAGSLAIVGFGGSKQRRVAGRWIDEFTLEPYGDFHAVWATSTTFWAVGGDWLSAAAPGKPRKGLVARYGQ